MIPITKLCLFFFIFLLISSCTKNIFEPDLNGTWEEINNTTAQAPTGCNLVITTANNEVSMCGVSMVHPYNTTAIFVNSKAKLYAKNGQIWYKERVMSFLWTVPIVTKDVYFIDYDFEGSFLWIVGENSNSKTTAKNASGGRVFRKK